MTWSRLLVDANRSPGNPAIWSTYTRGLPHRDRETLLDRWWWPHRRMVEAAIRGEIARGHPVLHVAVHSFTPVLAGVVRNADIGLLYDSRRTAEAKLCRRWQDSLRTLAPELRVRRNYPYLGLADGLPTWLRRRLPARVYAGVELELNQALLAGARRRGLVAALGDALETLL